MSLRCKCCNSQIDWFAKSKPQQDGSEQDMCTKCLDVVENINEPEEREYRFQELTEGVFVPNYNSFEQN